MRTRKYLHLGFWTAQRFTSCLLPIRTDGIVLKRDFVAARCCLSFALYLVSCVVCLVSCARVLCILCLVSCAQEVLCSRLLVCVSCIMQTSHIVLISFVFFLSIVLLLNSSPIDWVVLLISGLQQRATEWKQDWPQQVNISCCSSTAEQSPSWPCVNIQGLSSWWANAGGKTARDSGSWQVSPPSSQQSK